MTIRASVKYTSPWITLAPIILYQYTYHSDIHSLAVRYV